MVDTETIPETVGHDVEIHAKWDATPSQGTKHTQTQTHTQRHSQVLSHTQFSSANPPTCICLGSGRKPI